MHYYYLAFPFVLATCAFGGVLEQLVEALRPNLHPGLRQVGMLALTLLFFSWYPPVLSQHPVTGQARMTQAPSPFVVTDPAFFRNRKSRSLPPWPEIGEMRAYGEVLARDGYDDVTSNIWCDNLYANYRVRSVHGLGLTDAILGRVEAPEFKRGHKPRLQQLAEQMIVLQGNAGPIRAGDYQRAVADGRAPVWVENNLETISQIERKIFNRHHFFENLRIALSFPQKIQL
jgi:hypothetical protein